MLSYLSSYNIQILKTIETARPSIKFAINEQLLGGVRMASITI